MSMNNIRIVLNTLKSDILDILESLRVEHHILRRRDIYSSESEQKSTLHCYTAQVSECQTNPSIDCAKL